MSFYFQLLHRNWRDSLCGGPGGEGSRRRRQRKGVCLRILLVKLILGSDDVRGEDLIMAILR